MKERRSWRVELGASTLADVAYGGTLIPAGGVFVGRTAQLGEVSHALEAARASNPQVVAIEGDPGIGKTAFLRQCVAVAEDAVVLEASGEESETSLDLGVVSQLTSRASSVSSWGPLNAAVTGGATANPFVVGGELLRMLGSLQDGGLVVVVLDDAQWIDRASAGALLFALRRLYADRVCVLIATRPDGGDQVGSGWSRFLNDAERVKRVRLSGLDGHEVRWLAESLCNASLTAAAAERLREHTGGHPLYVRALLSELPAEALVFEHGPLPAPHSFAATVLARLANVANATQDLVAAAAVAGARCTVNLAGAVAGIRDPIAALDEALAAELLALAPTGAPGEVRFPHPLVRAAVYDDLSLTRRRNLHLACARLTAGEVSLAHRVAASPGADDALAEELAQTGDAEVADGRLAAGIEHLLLASRIAGSQTAREEALLKAVDALGVAGDVPRAHGLRGAVAACSDSPRRSFILGVLTASAGRLPEAIAALREVAERPDFPAHPELFGPVTSSLAIICAYAGEGPETITWARRALGTEQTAVTVEVTAKQALALGLSISGRGDDAVAVLESLSPTRIVPEPYEAELLATRGNLKAWCGDALGAVEDLSAVIRWSRTGSVPRSLPNAYSSLAEVEYGLGRWADGSAHADLAVSLAQDSDQVWELPFAHAVASFFHAGRGDWTIACEHIEAARRASDAAPLPLSVFYACLASARLASLRGDWDAALAALALVRSGAAGPVTATLGRRTWQLETEVLLEAGRVDAAARVLGRSGSELLDSGDAIARVQLWRLRGMLEHARGYHSTARDDFRRGQMAAKDAKSPLAEAELELAYGRFLRKTGRRSAATVRIQLARDLFEGLRARPRLEQCDAELGACGVRARSVTAGDYGLSAREQVVASLVASGKSNREVGEELYLSTKAIEYHMGNIFTKLGIRSRHQLASRLAG